MQIPVYKSCDLVLKNVDQAQGIVSGYFSAFGNVDYHNDRILPGAYRKSIQERGPQPNRESKIHHLLEHNTGEPIGKLLELGEDNVGLYFVSQISKAGKGPDVLIRYQEGIYKEHSVGIYIDKNKAPRDSKGVREVREALLIEGSTVLMGANDQTPVTSIKSQFANPMDLIEKKDRIAAYLKSGKAGTDELFLQLENELKFYTELIAEIMLLKTTQPENTSVQSTEPEELDADAIAKSVSNIILNYN